MSDFDFGFTDDDVVYLKALVYLKAAVEDDWICTPLYTDESMSSAAKLIRFGFTMQIIARVLKSGGPTYQASVHIWGPDRLVIKPPDVYNRVTILSGMRTCNDCGATNVDIQRVSFAGRVCANCIDQARKDREQPGWTA